MTTPEQFGVQVGAEVAKAVGEAAKEIILNFLGPSSKEIGLWGGDFVANWRMQNLVSTYQKIQSRFKGTKLPKESIERLPFGFRALFLEAAAEQENEDVQELWADLLSKGIQDGIDHDYKPIVDALKSFSPSMALVFKAICSQVVDDDGVSVALSSDRTSSAEEIAELDDKKILAALASLKRLGIIRNIDRRFNYNQRGSTRLPTNDVKRSLGAVAEAVDQLRMATQIDLEDSIERFRTDGTNVALISVLLTDFGYQFAEELGLDCQ